MKNWFKKNKIIVVLFFLILIPRFIFMLVAFFVLGDSGFVGGCDVYLPAGLNLLIHHTFTNFSSNLPLVPNSFPAPGYPILLGISWLIIPKYLFIVFWQNIMYALFIVFVYKFSRLFFNNTVSMMAAVFMAFEPFSFFWSNMVMSETPFLLFFMLSIYFLALSWRNQKLKYIIFSAIFLGLAALIRQIAFLFFPAIIAMTTIMFWRKVSLYKLAKLLIIFLLVFLAITAPWCIRNKIQFGNYTISNQTHLLYFLATTRSFLSLTTDLSIDEADKYLKNLAVEKAGAGNFNEISIVDKYIPIFKEISFSIIKDNPFSYLKWHLIKALPVLTDSGWMNILYFWHVDLSGDRSVNISNLLVQGDLQTLSYSLKNNQVFLVRILGIVFWLLIDAIAFFGIFLMIRKKEFLRIGLVMLIIIGYFFITSSWVAMARLRLPLQPFLFIFAAYAIYDFYLKLTIKNETR
ncbi:MAG: glycosyltransferase family 39 protein [Patescibacteria group bacterium]|nr:glycosyltransferase family 39 protein [Patescibacteria group bacterium]